MDCTVSVDPQPVFHILLYIPKMSREANTHCRAVLHGEKGGAGQEILLSLSGINNSWPWLPSPP